MSLRKINVNLTEVEYPFISRASGGGAFFNQQGSYPLLPTLSHVSNLWPMSGGVWRAVISRVEDHITAVTGDPLTAIANDLSRVVSIISGIYSSYALITRHNVYVLTTTGWVSIIYNPGVSYVSTALLKQQTFLHLTGLGTFQIPVSAVGDFTNIQSPNFIGLSTVNMVACCAASSYLIFVDRDTVYWSSVLDPTYFDPGGAADKYGAGSTKVLGITSPINFCVGIENGFYIFTDTNVVFAEYTGNVDNPWSFDVVENATGCSTLDYVNVESKTGVLFYWSKSGFAVLTNRECKYIAPELTTLLGGDIYEEYNAALHRKEISASSVVIEPRIRVLSNRFVAISYKVATVDYYTDVVVLDNVLGKWFHLKINHVDLVTLIENRYEGGLTYEDGDVLTFDEADNMSFEDTLPTAVNTQEQACKFGYLGTNGNFYSLSPVQQQIDLIPDPEFPYLNGLVLPNQMQFDDVRLSKSVHTQLQLIEITNQYENYSENTSYFDVATVVHVQSNEEPAGNAYGQARISGREARYSGRMGAAKFTVSLENINSLNCLTFYMDTLGTGFN